jgi:hypothetical protein
MITGLSCSIFHLEFIWIFEHDLSLHVEDLWFLSLILAWSWLLDCLIEKFCKENLSVFNCNFRRGFSPNSHSWIASRLATKL